MAAVLTPEAERLRYYQENPSKWAEHKFRIDLARYRSESSVVDFLEQSAFPHAWARSRLANGQMTLDASRSYQAEALDFMAEPLRRWPPPEHFTHRVAMKWANGIGKTATVALIALWFIDCFPGGRLLSTAGTWSQLREQLWREIATWNERAVDDDIISRAAGVDKTQIDVAPDWAAIGRAASGEATFEGIHAPDLMLIFDEAKAIRPDVWNAARRILRGSGRFWFLVTSSPGSPSGRFFEICRGDESANWNVLSMSAYEADRIALEQIDSDAEELGEMSPLFVAMDLGEFPDEGEKTLIPLSWVQAAIGRKVSTSGSRTLGVDVARYGADETVLVEIVGRQSAIMERFRGQNTTFTSGRVNDLSASRGYHAIAVDDIGVGGGVTDQVGAAGWPVLPIDYGSAALTPDRFVNLKSELYWRIRKEFETGFQDPDDQDVGLSLPDDKKLAAELTGIEFEYDERLRIKVEGHKQMARRAFASPNTADALVLANAARSDVGRSEMEAIGNVLPS